MSGRHISDIEASGAAADAYDDSESFHDGLCEWLAEVEVDTLPAALYTNLVEYWRTTPEYADAVEQWLQDMGDEPSGG